MTASTPLLSITGLTKSFGPTVVLDHVDISLKRGEVRALLGENGAGKSTLIKILAGIHQPDSGKIIINAAEKEFHFPRDSFLSGIATVHQEIMVSPGLSVAENVLLGSKTPSNFGKVMVNKLFNELILISRGIFEFNNISAIVSAVFFFLLAGFSRIILYFSSSFSIFVILTNRK